MACCGQCRGLGELQRVFDKDVCVSSGGTVTVWEGKPACRYADTATSDLLFELGTGKVLARVNHGTDQRYDMSEKTSYTTWAIVGIALGMFMFGGKRGR